MNFKQKSVLILSIITFNLPVCAQLTSVDLVWEEHQVENTDGDAPYTILYKPLTCEPCFDQVVDESAIPMYGQTIALSGNMEIADVQLINTSSSSRPDLRYANGIISQDYAIKIIHYTAGNEKYAQIQLTPIRKTSGGYETLDHFELRINYREVRLMSGTRHKKGTFTSVLSDGEIHKISVDRSGVYMIDATFLAAAGISFTGKKISELRVYGNGGVMLPEVIAEDRPDDLLENALYIRDLNGNDLMDAGDFVLFFAQGPDEVQFNTDADRYQYSNNYYEDKAYYFLKWSSGSGKRISAIPNGNALVPDLTLNSYDHVVFNQDPDEINFIHSGRYWWGYEMTNNSSREFSFNLPGAIVGEPLLFVSRAAARSLAPTNGSFNIKLDAGTFYNDFVSFVSGDFDARFSDTPMEVYSSLAIPSETFRFTFNFLSNHPDALAWIDFFTIYATRELKPYSDQQAFFNDQALINGNVKYSISGLSGSHMVWDVTETGNPRNQGTFTDGAAQAFTYTATEDEFRKYWIYKEGAAYSPVYLGKLENQNYHGLSDVEYLIITHPDLLEQAQRLADFHRTQSGLTVEVIDIKKLYNEFSSGSQDVTAIRDFVKLIYDRGQTGTKALKYLLLFGDASYDYKGRISPNTNMVPIYQSFNSHVPSSTHCSDDYYGILGDDEGYWGIQTKAEGLDLALGRLPASDNYEARIMVDKIIHYHSQASFGSWVLKTTVMADDQDKNTHLEDGEEITDDYLYIQSPFLNVNKIWLDAYEQVSFGSGNKYPDVNLEVNKTVNNGTLVFHYIGHGGQSGMAHERVVTRDMLSAWTNYNQLGFFITASCELGAFDNPSSESPAELLMLNPNGGAIGLISTTRVVFINVNDATNSSITDNNLFQVVNNDYKTLGEIYRDTRNRVVGSINARSFSLLGDPAMRLHYPDKKVVTTKVNGQDFSNFSDTLKALSKVTIEGEIHAPGGSLMDDFNGTLYPTFYDKFGVYQTLGNDPYSASTSDGSIPVPFKLQNNVIFKGKVSVVNGKFSFTFIVPKDISYQFGDGKLSYYAHNGIDQAMGYDLIPVGGTTDSLLDDSEAPELSLFIDDRSWVFGGSTNNTPLLLADIFDENGINTVGSGIGREMEAVLDKGTEHEQNIILNEFFQPELNSYQAGVIEYRFEDLSAGKHTLHLKVWDAYNNAAEAYTEFYVNSGDGLEVNNLLNYPNPFSTFTTFHFDHNKAGQHLNAVITIYSPAGNIVRSMTYDIPNAETHSSTITWDAKDDYGDPLARGVYLYTLDLKAEDGSTKKTTQKLYIVH